MKDLDDKNSLEYSIGIIKESRDRYIKCHESFGSRRQLLKSIKEQEESFKDESAEVRFNGLLVPSKKTIAMTRDTEIDGEKCVEKDYFYVGDEEGKIVFVKLTGENAGEIIRPAMNQVELSRVENSYPFWEIKVLKFSDGYQIKYCPKRDNHSSYTDYFYFNGKQFYNPDKALNLSRYMPVEDFNNNREITKVDVNTL